MTTADQFPDTAAVGFQENLDAEQAEAAAHPGASFGLQPQHHQYTVVVFRTNTHSQMHAQTVIDQWLNRNQPMELVEKWFAMDERYDGSDQDSAVLVHQGLQRDVQAKLVEIGVSVEANLSLTGEG